MSKLIEHAKREMELAEVDSDIYGDMLSKAVLELLETFASQEHSGMSGSIVLQLFNYLVEFKNLAPLTDDPAEWVEVGNQLWQSNRNTRAFSRDEGRTYSLNDELGSWTKDEHGNEYRSEIVRKSAKSASRAEENPVL